jgi:photosystem II stability/assembly factor-like uncharacterized protein
MLPILLLLATNLTPTTATDFLQPQFAASEKIVAVAFGSPDKVYLSVSHDRGATFSEPRKVADVPGLNIHRHRGPRVAITPTAIVVSAINGKDILTWSSKDEGRTWKAGAIVNDAAKAAEEGLHAMAARSDGLLFADWLDDREGRKELFGAYSSDNGATWSKNIRIYALPSGPICNCCHPTAIFAPDGELEVMWRNALEGSRDMYLASSQDGGKTFTTAEKLGSGTWKLDACPMDGGGVAITAQGKVMTAWRRGTDVYLAPRGGAETLIHEGKDPSIAANPEGVYIAWTAADGVFVRVPGKTEPVALDSTGAYVQLVAIPNGPVIAAWERKGTLQFHTLP